MTRNPPIRRWARPAVGALVLLLGVGASMVRADPPGRPPSDPVERLSNPNPRVRAAAATALGNLQELPALAVAPLRAARQDPEGVVQEAALQAMASLAPRHPAFVVDLVEALGSREVSHRQIAAKALAGLEAGVLAPRVEDILTHLDVRDAEIVTVLAPALLRFEPTVEQVVPVLVRCWRTTHAEALEPPITASGAVALPLLAEIFDDPDPRAREAVIGLLGRVPADALLRDARRLVPILLERLPTEPPRYGASDAFSLFVLLGPEVPDARARAVEIAARWLRTIDAQQGSRPSQQALQHAHDLSAGRVESLHLLLQIVVRWWQESDPTPANGWRPWESWIATLLPAVPDPLAEIGPVLERADDHLIRTIVANLAGRPNGDPVIRSVLASPDPARRRLVVQEYQSREPSPEIRLALLQFLREPDEALRMEVLNVLLAPTTWTAEGRLEAKPRWQSLTAVERVTVLDVLREWIQGTDETRRRLALNHVAQIGPDAKPLAPALVEIVRRADVHGSGWWGVSEAMTRIGAWDLARPFLLQWRDSSDPWIRAAAVTGLAYGHGDEPAHLVAQTRAILESDDPAIQTLGLVAVEALGSEAAPLADIFLRRVTSSDTNVVAAAVRALGTMGVRSDAVFDALVAVLHASDTAVVWATADTLSGFGARAVPALRAVAEQPGFEGPLMVLGKMSSTVPEARQAIEALASSPNVGVARYAKSLLRESRSGGGR